MNDHDFRRKYRPRFFSEVVGNARTKQKMINFIASGSPPNGILFYGPAGTGKNTLTNLLIRGLYCKNFDGDLCGECKNCLSLKVDFTGLSMSYDYYNCARIDGKDLERIINYLRYRPWPWLKWNIIIFDEFHRTKEPLQQKLLDIVEFKKEILLIFCLIDYQKIIEPFRQRVEVLRTSPPDIEELIPWLNGICNSEGIVIKDTNALGQIAIEANRSPRECIALLQSIHNLKEPLTIDLVREIAQDRQGTCTNGPEYVLAEN